MLPVSHTEVSTVTLNPTECNQLIDLLIETQGPHMAEDEIAEVIGLLLEDIPGLELITDDDLANLIDQLRGQYYVSIKETQ